MKAEFIEFEVKYYNAKQYLSSFGDEVVRPVENSSTVELANLLAQQQQFFADMNRRNVETPPPPVRPEVNVKLPQTTIPSFTGDYKAWVTFKDLFSTSVNDNNQLNAVQKFQYLKSFVVDEAASIISGIPLSEANYEVAWNRLKIFSNTIR